MQYPISNGAAIEFSKSFYEQVAQESPVDNAVQRARWNMIFRGDRGYENRDFGIPVLYMRSRDGILHKNAAPPDEVSVT
jgi:hypothetical protein